MAAFRKRAGAYICPECGKNANHSGVKFRRQAQLLIHRVRIHGHKLTEEEKGFWALIHRRTLVQAKAPAKVTRPVLVKRKNPRGPMPDHLMETAPEGVYLTFRSSPRWRLLVPHPVKISF
jgi:hypothetical protein